MRGRKHLRGFRAAVAIAVCMSAVPAAAAAHSASPQLRSHGADPAVAGFRHRISARAAAVEPGEPDSWCGAAGSVDDTVDQLSNGAYRYHAVYLYAADGQSRFSSDLGAQMQGSAFGASGLLEHLYGRAIRFDMGTNCGQQYLDISVVRSKLTSAQFAAAAKQPNGTLHAITQSLAAAGFPVFSSSMTRAAAAEFLTNYAVWLDAPAPAYTCGVADVFGDPSRKQDNWNNYGGKVAAVFRNGSDFCGEAALRHEIGHTLGALQADAPHAFDGSHCDDAYEDTMCYPNAPQRGSGVFENQFFDYGNDDYWDPPQGKPLRWWTLDLSRFICPTATCNTEADGSSPVVPVTSTRLHSRLPLCRYHRRAAAHRCKK
jgi:hypothetical protein